MKKIKLLGLAAVAACALVACAGAGSASASTFTCTGLTTCPAGETVHAVSEGHTTLHPIIGDIQCGSTIHGHISDTGSSTTSAKIVITSLSFSGCTSGALVTTLKGGFLEIHNKATNEGTVTSNGAEVTVEAFGFHCIFSTSGTDINTFTGSAKTGGGNATLDIAGTIPRTGGRSGAFCGSTAQWTGSYLITTPNPLNIH